MEFCVSGHRMTVLRRSLRKCLIRRKFPEHKLHELYRKPHGRSHVAGPKAYVEPEINSQFLGNPDITWDYLCGTLANTSSLRRSPEDSFVSYDIAV